MDIRFLVPFWPEPEPDIRYIPTKYPTAPPVCATLPCYISVS